MSVLHTEMCLAMFSNKLQDYILKYDIQHNNC